MGDMREKELGNRGFSLIELLVAMAVGAVVISAVLVLMSQGLKSYSKQAASAQLQEEAAIALNQISDAIMEAQCIEVNRYPDGKVQTFMTESGSSGNIYVFDQPGRKIFVGPSESSPELSLLCQYVDEFDVQMVTSGVENSDSVQIKVTLLLKLENVTREVSRTTNVRNRLSSDSIKIVMEQEGEFYG